MTLTSLKSVSIETPLPSPEELLNEFLLNPQGSYFIRRSREIVKNILNGVDKRLLLIAGPCSIHDFKAACEYAEKFKKLSEKVSKYFFLILRTYFEKPRTIVGWKGLFYDPDLDGSYNLTKGMQQTRKLLLQLTDMRVPVGAEILEINSSPYYSDLLTWGCVGARTSSSPPHRQLAASLNLPVGFKNSIDGNIDHAIHAILSAATPQTFLGVSPSGQMARIQADGNAMCHIVLRGGLTSPNYFPDSIEKTVQKCRQAKVREKIIIDCSHDNCGKNHTRQIPVFETVLEQILGGKKEIAGLMIESHLYAGSQAIVFPLRYGVSITDPCLDWESTERVILGACERLSRFNNT
jgi:3-deoxy-7-phosphoheptulonate synthase